jgi:hypothetical protein
MEYYSAIKKNEVLLFAGKWMELENIMLNEINQVQQDKVMCFLSYVKATYKYKPYNVYIPLYMYTHTHIYIYIYM